MNLREAFLGQAKAHEAERPSCLFLGRSDPQQELVASRATVAQLAQGLQQAHQLAPPNRLLLGPPPFTLGQYI
jgi:hypothetical protein